MTSGRPLGVPGWVRPSPGYSEGSMSVFALTLSLAAVPLASAQDTRPADLVASFESTAVRPIIAERGRPQAYGGVAAGGVDDLTDGFALPIGGGFGLTDRTEAGIDLSVGLVPFDVLERARLYGRVGLLPDRLAVQLGVWLPTESEENTGIELMVPGRWTTDRLQLFGQARASWAPGAEVLVMGAGGTVAGRVAGPIWTGLDLGGARSAVAGATATAASAALHVGAELSPETLLRLRFALPQLSAVDETDSWSGLSAQTMELMLVRRFGQ